MLTLIREFHLSTPWSNETAAHASRYLATRMFQPPVVGPAGLIAQRGSWWGNATAFDMRRVKAKIRIDARGTAVHCRLDVRTAFQIITDWNRSMFRLELVELQAWLQAGILMPDVWQQFLPHQSDDSKKFAMSLGLDRHQLTPEWAAYLTRLEAIQVFEPRLDVP